MTCAREENGLKCEGSLQNRKRKGRGSGSGRWGKNRDANVVGEDVCDGGGPSSTNMSMSCKESGGLG